ncbi:MAG: hypothetical protein NT062_16915, partial [Proteobacteria bacterium]|nr:hypothetical protein [Pseudomonadota bacterium]
QGRITWPDLYPPNELGGMEAGAAADAKAGAVTDGSQVDTSQIQAYQVREFVEALAGLRADLKSASTSTAASMRQAVLGPVSPLALARHVADAVDHATRSPTAGGFQLVEIAACLDEAVRLPVTGDAVQWADVLGQARTTVGALLARVQDAHPAAFPPDGPFRSFQRSLTAFHGEGR